ncbi:hypothetical protein FACS18942_05060 [Planctomycetales bacterium]|nr:hypothetical protein FACS18942_05060 [Planctomycetales bacterium]GHT37025.1 hypothetical protein FACS189427_09470 [Planctomycetales bacterium]
MTTIITFILSLFGKETIKSVAVQLLFKVLPPIKKPATAESVEVWLEEIIHGGIGGKIVDTIPGSVDNTILDYTDKTLLHTSLKAPLCAGIASIVNKS